MRFRVLRYMKLASSHYQLTAATRTPMTPFNISGIATVASSFRKAIIHPGLYCTHSAHGSHIRLQVPLTMQVALQCGGLITE
jgi:hypothetical protein